MTEAFVVLCTAPEDEARGLADQLLAERRIACANLIGPVESRYRWEGKIETGREMVLLMKTTPEQREGLRARIAELHSYSVPEVLELSVAGGLPDYLAWVAASCQPGAADA